IGGAGDDMLIGGPDLDTARYSAPRSAYSIIKSGVNTTVSGPDGTDTLTGVERLQFADDLIRVGITLFDSNADDKSDILWRHADGKVAIWQMNGTQIDSAATVGIVPQAWRIVDARGDYNGDGRSDILWRHTDGKVSIWQMNGTQIDTAATVDVVPTAWGIVD